MSEYSVKNNTPMSMRLETGDTFFVDHQVVVGIQINGEVYPLGGDSKELDRVRSCIAFVIDESELHIDKRVMLNG